MRTTLTIVLAFVASVAAAQTQVSRPIRFIVPFPAGGPVDLVARMVGQRVSSTLGQQVVVENRAGAGGVVGADFAAKQAADGSNVFLCSIHHTALPAMSNQLPYDFSRDFTAVAMGTTFPIIVVAHPSLPVSSLKELSTYARANAGKLTYASAGNGGGTHLAAELFKSLTKVDMVHVPYKGSAPAMTDVLGGQVPLMFADGPTALPQVRGKRVRALGVAQATRSGLAPDIPSAAENGFPTYDAYSWTGFAVPAATPKDVIARLSGEISRALSASDLKESLMARGAEPKPGTPEQFSAFIRAELTKWAKVVQTAGIRAD